MKVLFVGDVHNHTYMFDDVERLNKEYNFDRIIFLGDYVDDWNTTNNESSKTLLKVIELKESNPNKYTFCLGNHELSYLGYPCSGHQYDGDIVIEHLLKDDINLFDLYTTIKLGNLNYYCSHAGFTANFIRDDLGDSWEEVLKNMNENKLDNLELLSHCNFLRGGSHKNSSFLWADKREHTYDFNTIMPYQIIGHSPVKYIDLDLTDQIFIDTHSTYRSGEEYGDKSYLIWNEEEFEIKY